MNIRPGGTCGDSGDLSPVMLYINSFTLFGSVCKGTDKSGANISNHSCPLMIRIVLNWMCLQGKIKIDGKSFNIYMRLGHCRLVPSRFENVPPSL